MCAHYIANLIAILEFRRGLPYSLDVVHECYRTDDIIYTFYISQ